MVYKVVLMCLFCGVGVEVSTVASKQKLWLFLQVILICEYFHGDDFSKDISKCPMSSQMFPGPFVLKYLNARSDLLYLDVL